MKNLPQKKIEKSEVLKVMLVFVFAVIFISCNNDSIEDQNSESSKIEQQNPSNTQRMYYQYSIIVRNWGSHNIDCSQPNGFCYDIYTFNWHYLNLFKPDSTGTPVLIENEKGKFIMKIQKSALTEEHQKELLRNGEVYVIPEGQTIDPELVKSLKFNSDILVPGKYPIQETEETYTISINVK
ncbi:hypothetical protein [Flavobacterium chryseum]|uniref:hypothetical protein n=1 Tax=Flavobacterium sp. P3160 TaxID=2512113 RepID=UPI001FB6203D|nr:hypothetical protein [Flavobacterium sp. P3160]